MSGNDKETTSLADRLEDLVYTGVGLGVLAVNRAQVARRRLQAEAVDTDLGELGQPLAELADLLRDPERLRSLAATLRDELRLIDDRLDGLEHRVTEILDRVEPDLPAGLRELLGAVRTLTAENAGQVRSMLGLDPQ